MKALIRGGAALFTIGSAIYWETAISIQRDATWTAAEKARPPRGYFDSYLTDTVPLLIYAICCVLFCHWFARRIVKRVEARGKH